METEAIIDFRVLFVVIHNPCQYQIIRNFECHFDFSARIFYSIYHRGPQSSNKLQMRIPS